MQTSYSTLLHLSVLISFCCVCESTLSPTRLNCTSFASGQSKMNLEVNASGDKNKVFKINANDFLSMFSSIHGDKVKDGLVYKVQIGAYQFPDAFNYKHFAGMPKLIREIGKDHITRFSMGNYASYNEAHVLLKSLLANGLMDAFVVAIYKGERKTLSRLIEEKILE